MEKRCFLLAFMLTVMFNVVYGQEPLFKPEEVRLARNTNTTKEVYAKEFWKDMTFLGVPIKGSSLQFSKNLESVHFKSVMMYEEDPDAFLVNKGKFLDIDGWVLSAYSSAGECQYLNNDTVYKISIEKAINKDSSSVYFDKVKEYIDKTYPYLGVVTYHNNWDNAVGRMVFYSAYGDIILDTYYCPFRRKNYFRVFFDNMSVSSCLDDNSRSFSIGEFPDNYKDNKVTVNLIKHKDYVEITAVIDGKHLKIVPTGEDMRLFNQLYTKDKKIKKKPLIQYIKVIIEKNISKPHSATLGILTKSDVYDYYKDLEEKEKQAALDRKKREEVERIKKQVMYGVFKTAINMMGSHMSGYTTFDQQYRRSMGLGY